MRDVRLEEVSMLSKNLNENYFVEYQGTWRPHQTKGSKRSKIISEFEEAAGLISPRNKTR